MINYFFKKFQSNNFIKKKIKFLIFFVNSPAEEAFDLQAKQAMKSYHTLRNREKAEVLSIVNNVE